MVARQKLGNKMNKSLQWDDELLRILKILEQNGINISNIPIKATKDGKRYFIELKDINIEGKDIDSIIAQNNLSNNWPIGKYINKFRLMYNGTIKDKLSDENKRVAEKLGLVNSSNNKRHKTTKISDFHLEIVRQNIDKILNGEINTKELIAIINEQAIKTENSQIKDPSTAKRIVEMVLKDKPEQLKKYSETLRKNSGRRNPNKGKIGLRKDGEHEIGEVEFERKIIDIYLPKLISSAITLDAIAGELGTTTRTIDRVIKEYYSKSNNKEGLTQYEDAKKRNMGASIEGRKQAEKMREEVSLYIILSIRDFQLLSEEEQDKQIIMKIRKNMLKEEKNKECSSKILMTEEATKKSVDKIKEYFRSKNDIKNNRIYFTEEDIRKIIFLYPAIIKRKSNNLDNKIKVLTSYDEIDEKTAYTIIKEFPAIMGYSADRTKSQLDLLKKEKLIESIIKKPSICMYSANLMYALIEYAKIIHKTDDLSNIPFSNIFISNNSLERLYGIDYNLVKRIFPYNQTTDEIDVPYNISGQDIGKLACRNTDIQYVDESSELMKRLIESSLEKGNK